MAAGLLVLPGAGEVDRHVDLVDERLGSIARSRSGCRTGCPRSARRGRGSAGAPAGWRRTRCRRRRRASAPSPRRTAGRSSTRCVAHGTAKPVLRMPPGPQRAAVAVVDDRQRRDRREVRRLGARDVELLDAGVGDADHADLVATSPTAGRRSVSIASYPSRLCTGSNGRKEPPEQPVPRMFTPT